MVTSREAEYVLLFLNAVLFWVERTTDALNMALPFLKEIHIK
jgi:hypothetical protein